MFSRWSDYQVNFETPDAQFVSATGYYAQALEANNQYSWYYPWQISEGTFSTETEITFSIAHEGITYPISVFLIIEYEAIQSEE